MKFFRLLVLASSLNAQIIPSAAASSIGATYTIPAGDELATPVELKFEDARLIQSGSEAKLEFRLPAVLNGPEGKIFSLQGAVTKDVLLLESPDGDAECTLRLSGTNCQINFRDLNLDHFSAEQFTREIHGVDLAKDFKNVRIAFEHQAIGFITFIESTEVLILEDPVENFEK